MTIYRSVGAPRRKALTTLRDARKRAVPKGGQHGELNLRKADRKHCENRFAGFGIVIALLKSRREE